MDTRSWRTIGLEILRVHDEDCGDGSCGCGCGLTPRVTAKAAEEALEPRERCGPSPARGRFIAEG